MKINPTKCKTMNCEWFLESKYKFGKGLHPIGLCGKLTTFHDCKIGEIMKVKTKGDENKDVPKDCTFF